MSQNDMVIANQTAPNFRADLNLALQALASTSSGSSAPATTYANMLWYDTLANTLKMRSEADDAWIDLGVLDQSNLSFAPSNAVPIGAVNSFAMNSAPTGWLSCDGTAVSRTTYSGLFSVVSTTYGVGDGSTTFNLPDLRGEFVRGLDNGRGVDSGRVMGSAQTESLKSHTHDVDYFFGGASAPGKISGGETISADTATTSATGGDETRPRNIALLYCIKY